MNINDENLSKLDKDYAGYIEGDKIQKFFDDFGIKFSTGHWCAGDFFDRFCVKGYRSDDPEFKSDVISQVERVGRTGVKGLDLQSELFVNNDGEIDHALVKKTREKLDELNLTPTNMGCNVCGDPKFKLGGLANADPGLREEAIAQVRRGIEVAAEMGCSSVSHWPGTDGWDYCFQANYRDILERFITGCEQANLAAAEAGLAFGIEAKLHEPREGNMIVPTTHMATLMAQKVNQLCGGKNMGVIIDYGHEQMYAVTPAFTLYSARYFDVPVLNFHINDAKLHSNDEDRIAGTGDNWRLAEFCYAAIDIGYDGWFGEDQFTYRTDPVKAIVLSMELFANVMKKALAIYRDRDRLAAAQATGDAAGTIDAVKKILI